MANNFNADAVRLVKPYIDKAIKDAIDAALAENGDIAKAIADAVSTHAALTTGVHGLT
jgi:hypothetical protein